MKTKITTTFIAVALMLIAGTTKAQDAKYTSAMQIGLKQFNEAKSGADYLAVANHFERVGTIAKTQWLPYYYAAYSQLINNTLITNADEKDAVLDKAFDLLAKAESLNPQESEIFALKGYLSFMKIYVNPMARMQAGIGAAMADLEKAKAMNPSNPRPYFILAQNTFYTPEAFGGGKKLAKIKLEEATTKFDSFKPSSELMPNWGEERNAALLSECK